MSPLILGVSPLILGVSPLILGVSKWLTCDYITRMLITFLWKVLLKIRIQNMIKKYFFLIFPIVFYSKNQNFYSESPLILGVTPLILGVPTNDSIVIFINSCCTSSRYLQIQKSTKTWIFIWKQNAKYYFLSINNLFICFYVCSEWIHNRKSTFYQSMNNCHNVCQRKIRKCIDYHPSGNNHC